MLSIDFDAIRERGVYYKKSGYGSLIVLLIFLCGWFSLRDVLLNYRQALHCCQRGVHELVEVKQIRAQRQGLITSQALQLKKIAAVNTSAVTTPADPRVKPPAFWLSQHCHDCGIRRFHITERTDSMLGGQGRPIFEVVLQLNYVEAICVLSHFSEFKNDFDFLGLALERSAEQPVLKMNIDLAEAQENFRDF